MVTQNFLKLSSKPLEGFLKSFRRFRKNLWHLSDDTTKPGKVWMLFASPSLIIGKIRTLWQGRTGTNQAHCGSVGGTVRIHESTPWTPWTGTFYTIYRYNVLYIWYPFSIYKLRKWVKRCTGCTVNQESPQLFRSRISDNFRKMLP